MSGLPARRLGAQQISRHGFATAGDLVAWMGAVQAQDFAAAKWAIGLRLPDGAATDADVEDALARGAIVRTHVLRYTWQFVAPEDVRWMVALVAPRLFARNASRSRELGLDAATYRRGNAALEKALKGGRQLTRAELSEALRAAGISTEGQRLAHLIGRAELEGLICGGARRGKQFTWALLDEHVPKRRALERDEALAELARRYFRSRGPATVADFAWWSGLSPSDARDALEAVRSSLVSETIDGDTYWRADDPPRAPRARGAWLLPAFDEYLIAYRNRDAVLDPRRVRRINDRGGMLDPCVVYGGRVIGTWRRTIAKDAVRIAVDLFDEDGRAHVDAIRRAARRYGAFLAGRSR